MTLRQESTRVGPQHTPPEHTPRLRLKPKAPHSGYVDGAWWPRSDDLVAELPDLLAVLSVRLGTIDRVLYNVNEWAKAPSKLATGGRMVRLDGYRLQPMNTVEVLGLDRGRSALLVVPPSTVPDEAHATLMGAAAPGNDSTVDGLLVISARDREIRTQATGAQARWQSARERSAADLENVR
jgi:Family of unknown function (DUF5994)